MARKKSDDTPKETTWTVTGLVRRGGNEPKPVETPVWAATPEEAAEKGRDKLSEEHPGTVTVYNARESRGPNDAPAKPRRERRRPRA